MSKILNSLKYGNQKTKNYFRVTLGLLAFTVLTGTLGIIFSLMPLGVMAILCALIDVALFRSASFYEERFNEEEARELKRQELREKRITAQEKINKAVKQTREAAKEDIITEDTKTEDTKAGQNTNIYQQYNQKTLKRLLYTYKVKKEHYPILIDTYEKERVYRCPAFIWKDKTYLYFLLIQEEARLLKMPLPLCNGMRVQRGVPMNPSGEYPDLREKSLISTVFSPLLPKCYRGGDVNRVEYRKNLYSIGEEIWCTAPSVTNIRKLVKQDIILNDAKINSTRYNDYYREIYKMRLLWQDNIIRAEEFKEEVTITLTKMCKANIERTVFNNYLAQMLLEELIPHEYAEYALSTRRNEQKIVKKIPRS